MRVFRISISSLSSFCLVSLLCRFNCVCGASSLTWNWFPAGVQFKSFNCSSVPHRCTRDSYVSRSRSRSRSCCSCLGGLNAIAVRVVPQQSKSFNRCVLYDVLNGVSFVWSYRSLRWQDNWPESPVYLLWEPWMEGELPTRRLSRWSTGA